MAPYSRNFRGAGAGRISINVTSHALHCISAVNLLIFNQHRITISKCLCRSLAASTTKYSV